MISLPNDNYLSHFGIKGQKWGIRRYQNKDGTLTEEGKQRRKREVPESMTWKSKEARYLSDAELNRRNSRLQRERQYRELTKSKKRKVAEWIAKTASGILVVTAIGVAKGKMAGNYKTLLERWGPVAIASIAGLAGTAKLRFGKEKWVV